MVYAATGKLNEQAYKHAQENIREFLVDLGARARDYSGVAMLGRESEGDRLVFRVTCRGRSVDLQMPGLPLERVRGMDGVASSDLQFLHINGSPKFWSHALNDVAERLALDPVQRLDKSVGVADWSVEVVNNSGALRHFVSLSCLRIAGRSRFTLDVPRRDDGTADIEIGWRKRIECIEADGSEALVVIGDMASGQPGQFAFSRAGQDLEIEWTAEGFRIVPRQVTDTMS